MDQRIHNEQEYRELLSEHQQIQRKFESKVEALLKVSQELAQCRTERQLYKSQAVECADKCKAMKLALIAQKRERNRKESLAEEQQQNLAHVFKCVKEENKALNEEIEILKQQLEEARCDIKLMRAELSRQKYENYLSHDEDTDETEDSLSNIHVDKAKKDNGKFANTADDVLKELEKIRSEYSQLETDLKTLLCEKEELIIERDGYKTKTDRLNSELNSILNGDENRVIDIDALLAENRYLKERLLNAQEENGMAKAALSKYKAVMERAKKGSLKIVNGASKATNVSLITHKQARSIISDPDGDESKDVDYRVLASALYETVNDKNTALSHQRKANKILGSRITELESRVRNLDLSKSPNKPQRKMTADTEVQCGD